MPSTAISADFSRFWESNEERDLVWSALKPWFETYGYTLYPQDPDHSGNTRPEGSSVYELSKNSVELPHAYPQDVGLKGRAFLPKVGVSVFAPMQLTPPLCLSARRLSSCQQGMSRRNHQDASI